jgi:hypothetical protein
MIGDLGPDHSTVHRSAVCEALKVVILHARELRYQSVSGKFPNNIFARIPEHKMCNQFGLKNVELWMCRITVDMERIGSTLRSIILRSAFGVLLVFAPNPVPRKCRGHSPLR